MKTSHCSENFTDLLNTSESLSTVNRASTTMVNTSLPAVEINCINGNEVTDPGKSDIHMDWCPKRCDRPTISTCLFLTGLSWWIITDGLLWLAEGRTMKVLCNYQWVTYTWTSSVLGSHIWCCPKDLTKKARLREGIFKPVDVFSLKNYQAQ